MTWALLMYCTIQNSVISIWKLSKLVQTLKHLCPEKWGKYRHLTIILNTRCGRYSIQNVSWSYGWLYSVHVTNITLHLNLTLVIKSTWQNFLFTISLFLFEILVFKDRQIFCSKILWSNIDTTCHLIEKMAPESSFLTISTF